MIETDSQSHNAVVIRNQNFSWGLKGEEEEEEKGKKKAAKKGKKIEEKEEILEEDKSTDTVALDQSRAQKEPLIVKSQPNDAQNTSRGSISKDDLFGTGAK